MNPSLVQDFEANVDMKVDISIPNNTTLAGSNNPYMPIIQH
jgi:hypothetical protein